MVILKHILYKYISICTADSILAFFNVLFRVWFYTRSLTCCLLTSSMSNRKYTWLKIQWNSVQYVQIIPKVDKNYIKIIKTHRAKFWANKPLLKYFPHSFKSMFDDYTSWNISKVLRDAYPSMINMYTAHKPDRRFSSNFPCEFKKYYPLQIWSDFKSTGPFFLGFRTCPRTFGTNLVYTRVIPVNGRIS